MRAAGAPEMQKMREIRAAGAKNLENMRRRRTQKSHFPLRIRDYQDPHFPKFSPAARPKFSPAARDQGVGYVMEVWYKRLTFLAPPGSPV